MFKFKQQSAIFKTVRDRVLVTINHDWYRHRWPWMTLNDVIAFILLHFTEFDSFAGLLLHSGWS